VTDWAREEMCPQCGTQVRMTLGGTLRRHARMQPGHARMVHCERSYTRVDGLVPVWDIRAQNDPPGVDNPYWSNVRGLPGYADGGEDVTWHPIGARRSMVTHYAFTITDPVSVAFVAANAVYTGFNVVEVGAGTGYWAWQLAQRGVNVLAYDANPPGSGRGFGWRQASTTIHHPVVEGDARAVAAHPDRTLLLSWPPRERTMGYDALTAYTGDRLIYIGLPAGGHCADDQFFHALLSDWRLVAAHEPVTWDDVYDEITVWERR
jgi:hypothetical protein